MICHGRPVRAETGTITRADRARSQLAVLPQRLEAFEVACAADLPTLSSTIPLSPTPKSLRSHPCPSGRVRSVAGASRRRRSGAGCRSVSAHRRVGTRRRRRRGRRVGEDVGAKAPNSDAAEPSPEPALTSDGHDLPKPPIKCDVQRWRTRAETWANLRSAEPGRYSTLGSAGLAHDLAIGTAAAGAAGEGSGGLLGHQEGFGEHDLVGNGVGGDEDAALVIDADTRPGEDLAGELRTPRQLEARSKYKTLDRASLSKAASSRPSR